MRVVDLLEHTPAGMTEYAKNAPTIGLREALDYDHHSRTSRWRPGTRMAYCNSGPAVAAYIVEKITGQRFEDYVTENFFAPIGMKTAAYFQTTSAPFSNPGGRQASSTWSGCRGFCMWLIWLRRGLVLDLPLPSRWKGKRGCFSWLDCRAGGSIGLDWLGFC